VSRRTRDPRVIPHLFDRFWQATRTDRRGIGLGLSIVKALVEAHGGRMGVESTPGHGTTFRFSVPVAAPLSAPPLAQSTRSAPPLSRA
jgi:signal transduction histidine kinase